MIKFYPINGIKQLEDFTRYYFGFVNAYSKEIFSIDLKSKALTGDHLGLQVLSANEFDEATQALLKFSTKISSTIIHNRRNNTFKFNKPLVIDKIEIPLIEIFEPKPDADLSRLKPGIEHIAFVVKDFANFYLEHKDTMPIDKFVEQNGMKFFKTKFLNLIEIEFDSKSLADL